MARFILVRTSLTLCQDSRGVIVQIYACVLRRRRTHADAELAIEYGVPYRPGPYYVAMCITVRIEEGAKKKGRLELLFPRAHLTIH